MPPLPSDRLDSLTVQQIIAFCHVYEQGGYANAASSLGLAGPTIWEQVKSLERVYKETLFSRSGRNIQPTLSGRVLYGMLRPILAQFESTFERLAEETQRSAKQLRMVTGVRMMLEDLGKPLRQFQDCFPDAKLELTTADNVTAQQFVLDDKADLALLIEPPQAFIAEGIAYEQLYPLDYLAVIPPRHRFTRQAELTLQDLADEPLIIGNQSTIGRATLEQARFRLGINRPLNVIVETDNSAATLACVRFGMGVGIIAGRATGNLTKPLAVRSLSSELGHVNVVAAYRQGRQLTAVMRKLLDLIRRIS